MPPPPPAAGSKKQSRTSTLQVIAAVSPLLGLLGTVYGMIDAFQKTASSGGTAKTAKTAMLAEGIYEALVTTAAGLTIAIPTLLLYQFLLGRVDKLIDEIDEAGTEFIFSYTESHDKPLTATEASPESNDSSDSPVEAGTTQPAEA